MSTNSGSAIRDNKSGCVAGARLPQDKRLSGMTALVTGASRGIGKGIALALANAGCEVAVADIADPKLTDVVVHEIEASGGSAFAIRADVSSFTDVHRMFDDVLSRFSHLDVLVNNAGIQTWKCLLDMTEHDWDTVIDTNLKGPFVCTQFAAKLMKSRGKGSIINIGSGSNKLAFPNLSSYTASKGGLEMFTKVAAVELGPLGIRVNCVAPGAIEVERTRLEDPNYADTWGALTPLRRIGKPEDVGCVVVFLASDDSSYVNGQTIWVDGGLFSQPAWPYANR